MFHYNEIVKYTRKSSEEKEMYALVFPDTEQTFEV